MEPRINILYISNQKKKLKQKRECQLCLHLEVSFPEADKRKRNINKTDILIDIQMRT